MPFSSLLRACWCLFVLLAAVPAIGDGPEESMPRRVLTGIDVLKKNGFEQVSSGRIGLITNHTGKSRQGTSTAKLFSEADRVQLTTLFSPEHGFEGVLDRADIRDSRDTETGLKVYSLYGKTRRPTAAMLAQVDTLVFDIQDIGTRFYTYISTMGEAMLAADAHGKRFVVLDRPNPIGGVDVAGPMLDSGQESFVGFHSLPIRHGMTIGELALMFRSERKLSLELEVVRCQGWTRQMYWDQTGLLWVNPSPNMRNLTQALLYPGIGMLETTNLSVGRGTDTPFEIIGAPWIDPSKLADVLAAKQVPGLVVVPIRFTPDASRYQGESCGGVNFIIVNRAEFEPLRLGFALAASLRSLYPERWEATRAMRLLGNQRCLDAILDGRSLEEMLQISKQGIDAFNVRRGEFLIYR